MILSQYLYRFESIPILKRQSVHVLNNFLSLVNPHQPTVFNRASTPVHQGIISLITRGASNIPTNLRYLYTISLLHFGTHLSLISSCRYKTVLDEAVSEVLSKLNMAISRALTELVGGRTSQCRCFGWVISIFVGLLWSCGVEVRFTAIHRVVSVDTRLLLWYVWIEFSFGSFLGTL